MKCEKCGWDDNGSGDFAHVCGPFEIKKQIGWIENENGVYKLYAPTKGSIVTHAFILCKYCGGSVYHCMGPRYDAVCLSCHEKNKDLK